MSQHIHNLMGESMKGLRDLVDVDLSLIHISEPTRP